MWTWHVHQDFSQNLTLRGDWERLHRESPFPTVFGLFPFHHAAFENRRQNWSLKTVVGRDVTGTVRMIAPFASPHSQPSHWRFAIPDACDYDTLFYREGDAEAVGELGKWLSSNASWDRIDLQAVAGGRGELRYLSPHFVQRSQNRFKNALQVLLGGYPLSYEIQDSNHPYLSAQAMTAHNEALDQKQYQRHLRWFCKQRPLRLETLDSSETILAALPEFARLHRGQWGQEGEDALLPGSQPLDFLERLTRASYDAYPVRLHALKWGDELVAAHFGFEWQQRLYWYLPTYDVALSQRAPGRLLLAHLLQSVARKKNTEFDFLRGNEPYKLKLTVTTRTTSRLHTFRTRVSTVQAASERIRHVRIGYAGSLFSRLGSLFSQRHHAGGKSSS